MYKNTTTYISCLINIYKSYMTLFIMKLLDEQEMKNDHKQQRIAKSNNKRM